MSQTPFFLHSFLLQDGVTSINPQNPLYRPVLQMPPPPSHKVEIAHMCATQVGYINYTAFPCTKSNLAANCWV